MTHDTKRHILLVTLVAIPAIAVAMGDMRHGYRWVPDVDSAYCTRLIWTQVLPSQVIGYCMDSKGRAANPDASCALGCVVLSSYSEQQAKHIDVWGESLYDHEARHVFGRMRHPE